jgi:organic hydroperoxide reductase OsmC/OhrA
MQWGTGRRGRLQAEELPDLIVSTPPEFKGEPGFWTPEHLFVASAEACLMATFRAIAEHSGLKLLGYRSTARGRVEKVEGQGLRFTEIGIYPSVELEKAEDIGLAGRVMEKAAKSCLIANSMAVGVQVEPKFAVATAVAA